MSFKTSLSFIKNVFTVGAISETDPKTVKEICSKIRSEQDLVIVEFGMGHGNITQEILRRISKNSTLISFEINQDLSKKFTYSSVRKEQYVFWNFIETKQLLINEDCIKVYGETDILKNIKKNKYFA